MAPPRLLGADGPGPLGQAVPAQVHPKGHQPLGVHPADGVLHQGVVRAVLLAQHLLGDAQELLLQRAAGRLPSQIHQVADGSLGIGLDAVQTPPDDGLGHAAVHFSVRHIAHLASLLFCLYDKGGGRRGIWTLSPFCSKRKQPRRFM